MYRFLTYQNDAKVDVVMIYKLSVSEWNKGYNKFMYISHIDTHFKYYQVIK